MDTEREKILTVEGLQTEGPFAQVPELTVDEAQLILGVYQEAHPNINRWLDDKASQAKHIATPISQKFEADPRWNGYEKILPEECFLSIGPGPLEDRFYPVLMAPKDSPMVQGKEHYLKESPDGEFLILATLKMGYDTAYEALKEAGRTMTAVSVWHDGEYQWLWFDEFEANILRQADEKRRAKKERQMRRFNQGRAKTK